MINKMMANNLRRDKLRTPDDSAKVLMHSCCAPCAGEIMEAICASGLQLTVFFYNPNIHPKDEYEMRKAENIRFCAKKKIPFVDADYDTENWFARVRGYEDAPERGHRCTLCFDMRFERTALFAYENGFSVITSSLGISRWKNLAQINACGGRAAARYPAMHYWTHNWRKKGGSERMILIAKDEQFYQQEYCGCVFSLRDTNKWRAQSGRGRIKRGLRFYSKSGVSKYNHKIPC